MREKIEELINKYEEQLNELQSNNQENVFGCCDYTHLGAKESSIEEILEDLKTL